MIPSIQIGTLIGGKFRIDRVIGQGGNGIVVAATQVSLGRPVALKFLLPQACLNREMLARFVREARTAVTIRSHHVVEVLDVGELETGEPYLAMELLHGTDLSGLIRGHGGMGLSVEPAVEYALQACEGLAEAHARGIVHRDVKPTNLFVVKGSDGSPVLKVLDFGICKYEDQGSACITSSAVAMGSPLYMSPEQIRSARDVDERTDIWSLGAVLYEMLEGATPFRAATIPDLFLKIVSSPLHPMRRADVPGGLVAVVTQCLRQSPEERFPSVAALAHALVPFGPSDAASRAERILRILQCIGERRRTAMPIDAADVVAARGQLPYASTCPTLVLEPNAPELATLVPTLDSNTALGPPVAISVATEVSPVNHPGAVQPRNAVEPEVLCAKPERPSRASGRTRRGVLLSVGLVVIGSSALLAIAGAHGLGGASDPPTGETYAGASSSPNAMLPSEPREGNAVHTLSARTPEVVLHDPSAALSSTRNGGAVPYGASVAPNASVVTSLPRSADFRGDTAASPLRQTRRTYGAYPASSVTPLRDPSAPNQIDANTPAPSATKRPEAAHATHPDPLGRLNWRDLEQ